MPARPPPADPAVEAYLDAVNTWLTGPRPTRRAILDELRDVLYEAVAAHGRRGARPERAVPMALGEFGPPSTLAAGYAGELATARARRTTTAYLVTGPVVGLCWLSVLAPPVWWQRSPSVLLAAVPVAPVIAVAAVIGALVLAVTGRAGRWLQVSDQDPITGTMVVIAAAAAGDLLMLVVAARTAPTGAPALVTLAIVASTVRLGASAPAIAHCILSQRALTSTTP